MAEPSKRPMIQTVMGWLSGGGFYPYSVRPEAHGFFKFTTNVTCGDPFDYDPEYDIYPLDPQVEKWLETYCPGRYKPMNEGCDPESTWCRPIHFKRIEDATMFVLAWKHLVKRHD